jgi:hypothetical protein
MTHVDSLSTYHVPTLCRGLHSSTSHPKHSVGVTSHPDLLETEGDLLKDPNPVGLSAGRSVGLLKWTVLIGRTGFITRTSIADTELDVSIFCGLLTSTSQSILSTFMWLGCVFES